MCFFLKSDQLFHLTREFILGLDWIQSCSTTSFTSGHALATMMVFITQINGSFICTYFCPILCPVGIKNFVADEYSNQSALGLMFITLRSGPIKIIPVDHVILCFESFKLSALPHFKHLKILHKKSSSILH